MSNEERFVLAFVSAACAGLMLFLLFGCDGLTVKPNDGSDRQRVWDKR